MIQDSFSLKKSPSIFNAFISFFFFIYLFIFIHIYFLIPFLTANEEGRVPGPLSRKKTYFRSSPLSAILHIVGIVAVSSTPSDCRMSVLVFSASIRRCAGFFVLLFRTS